MFDKLSKCPCVLPPTDRCKVQYSPDLPIASIVPWPDESHRSTLNAYLQDPHVIHREARVQIEKYTRIIWPAIQEILDWECCTDARNTS